MACISFGTGPLPPPLQVYPDSEISAPFPHAPSLIMHVAHPSYQAKRAHKRIKRHQNILKLGSFFQNEPICKRLCKPYKFL